MERLSFLTKSFTNGKIFLKWCELRCPLSDALYVVLVWPWFLKKLVAINFNIFSYSKSFQKIRRMKHQTNIRHIIRILHAGITNFYIIDVLINFYIHQTGNDVSFYIKFSWNYFLNYNQIILNKILYSLMFLSSYTYSYICWLHDSFNGKL